MTRILALARAELRIAARNRWVIIAVAMMGLFSLALAAAGSAPTGALGADRLSVVVASLTSLAVYLVPLVALLMSFDAVAGEVERGTLPLLLTYPVSRAQVREIAQAKMADLSGVRGLFLQLARPIDFQAVDGLPVDLLFVLLSPLDAGADHLKALAGVSRMLRNDAIAERLRGAKSDEALYALLADTETRDAA